MDVKDELPISEARANLSEVINQVRLLRRCVRLTSRGKPHAALVPVELADAAGDAGGPEIAAEILRNHVAGGTAPGGQDAVALDPAEE